MRADKTERVGVRMFNHEKVRIHTLLLLQAWGETYNKWWSHSLLRYNHQPLKLKCA